MSKHVTSYVTTPGGRRLAAPKPITVGKRAGRTWVIEADFGEARGLRDGRVHGYATESSARTHEFIIDRPPHQRPRVVELFSGRGSAPNYIRLRMGRMMRELVRCAMRAGGAPC